MDQLWQNIINSSTHEMCVLQAKYYKFPNCIEEYKKDVPSAESSRTVRGLGKGVNGKPYPHEVQCEETATRTWDLSVTGGEALPLHQARPSLT